MRYFTAIVGVTAMMLTTGCVRTSTQEATGDVDVDIESPTKRGEDWHGKMLGKGNWSGLSGDVQALVLEGRTSVTVAITGAQPGAVLPWHIHEGTCESGGEIVGGHDSYMPMIVGSDGRGSANAQINVGLDEAKDYFVSFHASQNEMATIVACGDIDD